MNKKLISIDDFFKYSKPYFPNVALQNNMRNWKIKLSFKE